MLAWLLASAEVRREILPPELITGQETIKLPSRFVCYACTLLLLLPAIDSPRTLYHLLEIHPRKASERSNRSPCQNTFLYKKLGLIRTASNCLRLYTSQVLIFWETPLELRQRLIPNPESRTKLSN